MQSVPITTEFVGSNPVHGEVYSIQHYVIKFVSDMHATGRWFSDPVFSTNKTDRHDITEILLKVALNTIILNPLMFVNCKIYYMLFSYQTGYIM